MTGACARMTLEKPSGCISENIFHQKLLREANLHKDHSGNTITSQNGRGLNQALSCQIHLGRGAAKSYRRRENIDLCQVQMSGFQKENDAAKSLFRRLEVFFFNVI